MWSLRADFITPHLFLVLHVICSRGYEMETCLQIWFLATFTHNIWIDGALVEQFTRVVASYSINKKYTYTVAHYMYVYAM